MNGIVLRRAGYAATRIIGALAPGTFDLAFLICQLERGVDLVIVAGATQVLSNIAARHPVLYRAAHLFGLAVCRHDCPATFPIATKLDERITRRLCGGGLDRRSQGRSEDEPYQRHCLMSGRRMSGRRKQIISHGHSCGFPELALVHGVATPSFVMSGIS